MLKKPILQAFLVFYCPDTSGRLGNFAVGGSCWVLGGYKDIHGTLLAVHFFLAVPTDYIY